MNGTDDQLDNEARLTAYVLGELDEEEAAAIEAQMEHDASLRQEVEAIRRTTRMLEAELKAEPAPGLTEGQRAAIAAGPPRESPVIFTIRRVWGGVAVAAAACIVIALFLTMNPSASREGERFAIDQNERIKEGGRADKDDRVDALRNEGAGAPAPAEAESEVAAGPPGDAEPYDSFANRFGAPDSAMDDTIESYAGLERESLRFAQAEETGQAGGKSTTDERLGAGETAPAVMAPPPADEPAKPKGNERVPVASRDRSGGDGKAAGGMGGGASAGRRGPPPTESRRPPPGPGAGGIGAGGAGGSRLGSGWAARGIAPQEPAVWESRNGGVIIAGEEHQERARQIGRDAYGRLIDNPFIRPEGVKALSTFSIDVDTASYANVRNWISSGALPPADAVRIEEMINYFDYAYEPASGEHPFSINLEVNACPWNDEHRLVRIGLKGREVAADMRPATSLVFLIDVSGSMRPDNKLPLLKQTMKALVEHLLADDRVAIVTYANDARLVLPSSYCDEKQAILDAIDGLHAGGSTHGSAGLELAYQVAQEGFIKEGVNRVILCTDGDFNVGTSDEGGLVRLIEQKRKSGVFLSVLGFGTGNWQDSKMEQLTNAGNGNCAYIDSLEEGKKVLIDEMSGTLVTIAKDVKIQVEFNPAKVGAYRLIGYANRLLEARDFNDDTRDAGEIGAGHTVTALYEIIPPGEAIPEPEVDELKYQQTPEQEDAEPIGSDELLTVKLRYKEPEGETSARIERPLIDAGAGLADMSEDFQFASAVAAFGMILRDSPYKGQATYAGVLDLATAGLENDERGHRAEFIALVEKARALAEK
jgi:Ca-activated chloride channel family protein